jgi:hypothetical protein
MLNKQDIATVATFKTQNGATPKNYFKQIAQGNFSS